MDYIERDDVEMLQHKINSGEDINLKDEETNTNLHIAAKYNSLRVCMILCLNRADPMQQIFRTTHHYIFQLRTTAKMLPKFFASLVLISILKIQTIQQQ